MVVNRAGTKDTSIDKDPDIMRLQVRFFFNFLRLFILIFFCYNFSILDLIQLDKSHNLLVFSNIPNT